MQARIKQREEVKIGKNWQGSWYKRLEHAEQLSSDCETILERVAGYHSRVDGCIAEMSK